MFLKINEFNKMKCDSFNGTTQQCFCLVFKNYNMINGCNFEDGQWGIYNASAKLLKIGGWFLLFILVNQYL
jgi:hypothetical protein